jgi:phosphoribosylformimino-5-aminoimidazole carboxamide ribotide isomerase
MVTVFPVIDLLHGQVVRAVRGDRSAYRPIVSALCASSEPLTVALALRERCQARALYVADLEALQGAAPQVAVLQALLRGLPGVELWVDAGFADPDAADALRRQLGSAAARLVPVFGSESLRSRAALEACFAKNAAGTEQAALSLDRRDGRRLDAAGCWDAPQLWPQRVIVMTLERVGGNAGPDLETIADVRRMAPSATVIGAGGIRHAADLVAAGAAGADAWLVSSALHDARL